MVAGAAKTCVVLIYDGRQLELDASVANRRGGLRALQLEAELAWGLHPKSYTIFDAVGKVDSQEALRHTLQGSKDGGSCVLDIREHSEWKALRMSMATFENKILAKVDNALAHVREDMNQMGAAVNGTVAPMLKCMSLEMVEVRSRIEQAEKVLSQSIAPMMQQIAHEQIDLRARCAGFCDGFAPLVPLVKCVALEQLELKSSHSNNHVAAARGQADADVHNLQEKLGNDVSHRICHLEQADEFLFHELQELQNSAKAAQLDLREVKEDVKGLIKSHADRVCKQVNAETDARFGWKEPLTNGIPFSGKLSAGILPGGQSKKVGAAWKCSGNEMLGVAPSFARGLPIRPLERMMCSRSTPHLPPLL